MTAPPDDLASQALDLKGEPNQLAQAQEEIAELIEAIATLARLSVTISHRRRGRADVGALADEVADVEIMLEQLREVIRRETGSGHAMAHAMSDARRRKRSKAWGNVLDKAPQPKSWFKEDEPTLLSITVGTALCSFRDAAARAIELAQDHELVYFQHDDTTVEVRKSWTFEQLESVWQHAANAPTELDEDARSKIATEAEVIIRAGAQLSMVIQPELPIALPNMSKDELTLDDARSLVSTIERALSEVKDITGLSAREPQICGRWIVDPSFTARLRSSHESLALVHEAYPLHNVTLYHDESVRMRPKSGVGECLEFGSCAEALEKS